MSHLSRKWAGKEIICPKCGKRGKLCVRTRSHLKYKKTYYWQVSHGNGKYCYLGKRLPQSVLNQLKEMEKTE